MAMKGPIGAGLSLASPPCASNDRSLVLKSAFFGHGGTVLISFMGIAQILFFMLK